MLQLFCDPDPSEVSDLHSNMAGLSDPSAAKPSMDPTEEPFVPKVRNMKDVKTDFQLLQQFDYVREATKKNVWYYRDRVSIPRGPCTLPVLRKAWVHGIIDQHTLVWGDGLIDWLPIRNVRTLVPQIRTLEVQAATFLKRQFTLKPMLEQVRRQRKQFRVHTTSQVDDMM